VRIDTHLMRDYVLDLLVREFGFPADRTDALRGKNAFLTNVVRSDVPVQPADTVPHHDEYLFAAQVYLNAPEQCRGGTGFYRHRATGLERFPFNELLLRRYREHVEPILKANGITTAEELKALVANKRKYDDFITDSNEEWELIHLVGMEYNRLTVYEGSLFHAAYIERPWFADYYRIAQVLFL